MLINIVAKKRILFVFIILTIILMASVLYIIWKPFSVNNQPEGATVVQAFGASGAKFAELEVNGWEKCDVKLVQVEAEEYLKKRLQRLFPLEERVPQIKTVRYGGGFITQALGKTEQGIIVLATLNINSQLERQADEQVYFTVTLRTKNPQCSFNRLDNMLNTIMESDSYHRSTIIKGEIAGRVNNYQRQKVIQDMIKEVGANTVNTYDSGSMVSISAHTSKLPEGLTIAGQSININMAARYNSVEKKTILYVGSPIITCEY
ncbi:YwmB family TATA-box binding protein [Phosphitispora sp. TUW77]|uniref:YwmB family TATA-box binding protein n=1 Tax=Phosphitispora sp. TUW77 TaxID=3152361 RepID=UPI003AB4434C